MGPLDKTLKTFDPDYHSQASDTEEDDDPGTEEDNVAALGANKKPQSATKAKGVSVKTMPSKPSP